MRLASACATIVALLFSPIAVSGHACPFMGDMAAAMQSMSDAGGTPMDAGLCERHCNEGKVSLDLAKPALPAQVPVVAALRVDALEPVALRAPAFDSPYAFAGPAPPLIGTTVLRI